MNAWESWREVWECGHGREEGGVEGGGWMRAEGEGASGRSSVTRRGRPLPLPLRRGRGCGCAVRLVRGRHLHLVLRQARLRRREWHLPQALERDEQRARDRRGALRLETLRRRQPLAHGHQVADEPQLLVAVERPQRARVDPLPLCEHQLLARRVLLPGAARAREHVHA